MRAGQTLRSAVVLGLILGGAGRGWSEGAVAQDALALCRLADALHGAARARTLSHSLALAEAAVRTSPESADAHFAVFCALGKQLEERGIGWRALADLRRVRRAVDRALEIDPNHVDALIGKSLMLSRLPRMFGGDPAEARRCLERAYRRAPAHPVAGPLWRKAASQ